MIRGLTAQAPGCYCRDMKTYDEVRERVESTKKKHAEGNTLLSEAFEEWAGYDDEDVAALGYPDYDTFYATEAKPLTKDTLRVFQRQANVAKLRRQGLSLRAIAERLGVGKSTVDRDLDKLGQTIVPGGTMPERITRPDGSTYPARRAVVEDEDEDEDETIDMDETEARLAQFAGKTVAELRQGIEFNETQRKVAQALEDKQTRLNRRLCKMYDPYEAQAIIADIDEMHTPEEWGWLKLAAHDMIEIAEEIMRRVEEKEQTQPTLRRIK